MSAVVTLLSPGEAEVLDALDDAPESTILGDAAYTGPAATIQWLAWWLNLSDSTVRTRVHGLRERGLCHIIDALDPKAGTRRLFVIGKAF